MLKNAFLNETERLIDVQKRKRMMGPLSGLRILEMAGVGPAPFCGMLLADLGADVLRIDRIGDADLGLAFERRFDLLDRGKRAAAVDIKASEGVALVLDLVAHADALIEGFRPGVMERLGLGPDVCATRNAKLVYGRMTGWGQDGPRKAQAGHDINYIALAGALSAIGPTDGDPLPPLNLVGDFGGGGAYLAFGVMAAVWEAQRSGRGQVVDAAMVDGTASLMAMTLGFRQAGLWRQERGRNILDGGAPYYRTYRTRDGGHMAVGAIEKRFYQQLLKKLDLADAGLPAPSAPKNWDVIRERFQATFATKTRAEWTEIFADSDACVAPVLDLDEARTDPHLAARGVFVERDGVTHPEAAPRFSRTPGRAGDTPRDPKIDGADALEAWGVSKAQVEALAKSGTLAVRDAARH